MTPRHQWVMLRAIAAGSLAIGLMAAGCDRRSQPEDKNKTVPPPAEQSAAQPSANQQRSRAQRPEGQKEARPEVYEMPSRDFLLKLKIEHFDRRLLEGRVEMGMYTGLFPANRFGDQGCGGVLVGEQVYLTAAHCIENDPNIKVAGIDATCEPDPQFPKPRPLGFRPHDVAACKLQSPVNNVTFETIDTVAANLAVGHAIMLTGYGGSSIYYIGTHLHGPTTLASINSDNSLTTDGTTWVRKGYGGDSGGAAYHWEKPAKRRVIAVNAAEGSGPQESLLWPLAPSASWLSTWSSTNNAPICGLDGFSSSKCHQ